MTHQVDTTAVDTPVQCVRCRHRHTQSQRQLAIIDSVRSALVCPRCSARSYFDLTPQVAWCWSSGLIEMGDEDDVPDGAIQIASGAKAYLTGVIAALARHGQGASAGMHLVPGVPEADSQEAKGDALAKWLKWCAGNNGHKGRHGVEFVTPNY